MDSQHTGDGAHSPTSPTPDPSPKGEGRIRPGKNRLTQVARTGSRKLFDAARREVFLEWFAATCNVKLSAEKADVCYQTVFRHRMKDEGFAEAWDRALAQGYARLEARLLQAAMPPLPSAASPLLPSPAEGEGPSEAEIEAAFDPGLAIVLLREHARRLPGSGDKRKAFKPGHRVASNAEVKAALVKRLKAFGVRVGRAPQSPDADPSHHAD